MYSPPWGAGCLKAAYVLHVCPRFQSVRQVPSPTWQGRHSTIPNKSLPHRATRSIRVCKLILTDLKTWKRALLILLHAAEKMGEERAETMGRNTPPPHTHTARKKLLASNYNRETHFLKATVIKRHDPNLQKTSKGIDLFYHHTSTPVFIARRLWVYPVSALPKCWKWKGEQEVQVWRGVW